MPIPASDRLPSRLSIERQPWAEGKAPLLVGVTDQRQQGCLLRPAQAHPCDAQHMTSMSCDGRLRQSLLPLLELRVACWQNGELAELALCSTGIAAIVQRSWSIEIDPTKVRGEHGNEVWLIGIPTIPSGQMVRLSLHEWIYGESAELALCPLLRPAPPVLVDCS